MKISFDLNERQVKELESKRGSRTAESYLKSRFGATVSIQKNIQKSPSWLGDIDGFENELSKI